MRYLRENTATRITVGPFLDVSDGFTPELALTVTGIHLTLVVDDAGVPTLALDADATGSGGDNDMLHITNDNAGFYDLELTAAQVNFTGRAIFAAIDDSEHLPVFHEFQIVRANVYDSLFIDGDLLDVTVIGAVASVSGNVDGSVGSVAGNVDGSVGSVAGNVDGSVASNVELGPSEVASEMSDALRVDTLTATPVGAPPTLPTVMQALMVVYDALVHKVDVDATAKEFYNNAGTLIWQKALSDDATNYVEAESTSG